MTIPNIVSPTTDFSTGDFIEIKIRKSFTSHVLNDLHTIILTYPILHSLTTFSNITV